MEERLDYIDVLKCVATILIVSIHFQVTGVTILYDNITLIGIIRKVFVDMAALGVPIFFMINGALLLNKKSSINKNTCRGGVKNQKYIFKKIINLFFKYCIWSTITIVLISKVNGTNLFINDKASLINSFIFGNFPGIDMNHLWFIRTLIAIYFIFPFINNIFDDNNNDKKICLIILIIISFVIPTINLFGGVIPFIHNIGLECLNNFFPLVYPLNTMLSYFILGGLLQKNNEKVVKIKYKYLLLLFITGIILLEVNCYIASITQGSTISGVYAEYNGVPVLIMSISLFITSMKLFQKITISKKIKNFIRTISSNTISVYYLNWILGYTILSSITFKVMNLFHISYSVSFNYIRAIIIVIICSYFGMICKKIPIIKEIF